MGGGQISKSAKSPTAAKKSITEQESLKALGWTIKNGAPGHCPGETALGKVTAFG